MTLNPPAVEPADPPIHIKSKRINCEKRGQSTVFPKPKPVVVMVLETWKNDISKLSAIFPWKIWRILKVMRRVETPTIVKYPFSSSSAKKALNFLIRKK